jgi:hypothetical protein
MHFMVDYVPLVRFMLTSLTYNSLPRVPVFKSKVGTQQFVSSVCNLC